MEFVLDVPRNLPLKFGQNRVSNSRDIADIKFVWGVAGCKVTFVSKPTKGYVRLRLSWVVVELGVDNISLASTISTQTYHCHGYFYSDSSLSRTMLLSHITVLNQITQRYHCLRKYYSNISHCFKYSYSIISLYGQYYWDISFSYKISIRHITFMNSITGTYHCLAQYTSHIWLYWAISLKKNQCLGQVCSNNQDF